MISKDLSNTKLNLETINAIAARKIAIADAKTGLSAEQRLIALAKLEDAEALIALALRIAQDYM